MTGSPPPTELGLLAIGVTVTILAWTFTGWTVVAIAMVGCACVFAALVLQRRRTT
jgi:hypothetical protein